jgi:(S)-ureidoglycine aminohydrolase
MNMHQLGFTRSANCADHILQTPDTFVRAPLPGMRNATAIVHIAPARGARFTQYTAEFQLGGYLPPSPAQRFVYVLEGEVHAGAKRLGAGEYLYCPHQAATSIETPRTTARVAIIEKEYEVLAGITQAALFTGREDDIASEALEGDPSLQVRHLLPNDASFDFAVNAMTYQPGAALPMVEIHIMEHGLLMLEGGGIYRLGDRWYPVTAGDFIWMAPYCPQWFGALGKKPAKYLIYKDWNR